MHYFEKKKPLLVKEINSILRDFRKKSQSGYVWSDDAISRLEQFIVPGKMIRGILVMLSAGEGKAVRSDAVKLGAALEIIHSSILIHDDIMDRDAKRRGLPTVHFQYKTEAEKILSAPESLHYGEGMAICLGIIGYFLAMGRLSRITHHPAAAKIIKLFSDEMALLGLGQMDDFHTGTIHAVSREDCLRIYEQKTGRYSFGLPLMTGLLLAGKSNSKVENTVMKLSKSLGIMFQLRDDYLGIFGDDKKTGKSVGGDITERKKTWFYFAAMDTAPSKDAKRLRELYDGYRKVISKDRKWVLDLMIKCDLPKLAVEELISQKQVSLKWLKEMPFDNKQKEAMASLIDLLISRVS